jgi:GMP synthase (glutamine-hydrolysing)
MPTTLALRHVAFEDLGLLAPLLAQRGHTVRYVDVPTADLDAVDVLTPDLLVVLGGPIGVYENDRYPFLDREIDWLARRIEAGRPLLGICLGAQLIARALGARVYPSGTKELGWGRITLTPAGQGSCLSHLAETEVLHWHGDTFDLPDGAVHLASTAACRNQAFSYGERTLALQFHAEAEARGLESWFVGHTCEIGATPGVSVPALREATQRFGPALAGRGAACFGAWLAAQGF